MLTMPDFEAAAAHPAPVVCDATLASPLRLRPLERGCDVSLHSATKVLAGHDDLIAGVATVTDDDALRPPAPDATADRARRLGRHGLAPRARPGDARGAARPDGGNRPRPRRTASPNHPAVTTVRYPGFGFLISFDVADGEAARRVEVATATIENATSLGGTRTKLESRHRWEGERVPRRAAAAVGRARDRRRRSGPTSSRRWHRPEGTRPKHDPARVSRGEPRPRDEPARSERGLPRYR